MENIIDGLEITVIGMSVVFFILLVLYAALKGMELIFAEQAEPKPAEAERAPPDSQAEKPQLAGDPDEETATAIAAAVAAHIAREEKRTG